MAGKRKNYEPIWRRIKWDVGYNLLPWPLPFWWSDSDLKVELAEIDDEWKPRFHLPANVQERFKSIPWESLQKRVANWSMIKTRVDEVTKNLDGLHSANTLAVAVYGPLLNADRRTHHKYNYAEQFCFDGTTLRTTFPELCSKQDPVDVEYQATSLLFKRDVIQGLAPNGRFRISTPYGCFVFTRAQFESAFENVPKTTSFQNRGGYSYTKPPERTKAFLDLDPSKLPENERFTIAEVLKRVVAMGIVDPPEMTPIGDDIESSEQAPDPGDDDDDDFEMDARYAARNVILFGPPGTGKSFRLQNSFLAGIGVREEDGRVFRVTFHPESSYFDFVGAYKPLLGLERAEHAAVEIDGTEMKLPGGEAARPLVYYGFEPGPFTEALRAALADPTKNFALIIEEINRGNCAAVFGDVFQLLDRDAQHRSQYAIRPSAALAHYLQPALKKKVTELRLPSNLFIYGTMNTSDQSLFPMDTAFKRRWSLEYVGISFEDPKVRQVMVPICEKTYRPWWMVATAVNKRVVAYTGVDDKQMGPYFVQPAAGNQVTPAAYRSKVLFYLWNDVFRGNTRLVFDEQIATYDALVSAHRENHAVFAKELIENIETMFSEGSPGSS